MEMIKSSLYLTKNQIKRLKELAKGGISVSEHIRRAIDSYLAYMKKEQDKDE